MLNRLDLRGLGTAVEDRLPRPAIAGDGPRAVVRDLIDEVRRDGDAALCRLTERFDGVSLSSIRVPEAELDAALAAIPPALRAAMEAAIEGIEAFHRHQVRPPHVVESPGMTIRAYQKPMGRAGLYVPGGRAEYPSTVLMTAVPARVAGVGEIVLCVPPDRRIGAIAPSVLAAARLAGVSEVYAVGGAQAIAAMAYGTESIRPVDVIAGPGNVYVALAKQEVAGQVGIAAAFAGPSEVVVVADAGANPELAAIDVIVQAEHGPDGLAWLVTWDEAVADAVCAAGERLLADAPRAADVRSTLAAGGYAVLVDDPAAALAVVNAIAPEHLELQCAGADELAGRVDNAGAIFCGPWSPASVGDYVAGPSHVLPTYGSARFASALTVADFCKDHHVVTLDPAGIQRLGPHVVALADAEGLDAHAASVRLRLDLLGASPSPGGAAGRWGGGPDGDGEAAQPPGAASPPNDRPSVRDDLKTLDGYHSPQLTVDVRLNTNEAPEPPPEAFTRAVEAAVAGVEWHRYPDRAATDLRAAIGALHGVPGDQVFCANGSNEVIQTVLLAFAGPGRTVATFEPTYAMHAHIARITGATSVVGERRDDFTLDLDDVARVIATERPAVTFLCSPNNPTGTVETEESVRAVLGMVEAVGGLLFVDEAYGQFAPWSAATLLDDDRALVVSRTFSKTWAMAGARLGYLLAPAWLVGELEKVVLPYHLDTLKQRAGLAALGFVDDMERRVSSIVEERGRIEATLRELGCEVWPSGANFVLFRPTRPGRQVWQGLVDRSVLVRDVSGWDRLDGCLRVTVGTAADNDRFLAGMTELLEETAP